MRGAKAAGPPPKFTRRIPLTLDTRRFTAITSPFPAATGFLPVIKLHVVNQAIPSLPLPIIRKRTAFAPRSTARNPRSPEGENIHPPITFFFHHSPERGCKALRTMSESNQAHLREARISSTLFLKGGQHGKVNAELLEKKQVVHARTPGHLGAGILRIRHFFR